MRHIIWQVDTALLQDFVGHSMITESSILFYYRLLRLLFFFFYFVVFIYPISSFWYILVTLQDIIMHFLNNIFITFSTFTYSVEIIPLINSSWYFETNFPIKHIRLGRPQFFTRQLNNNACYCARANCQCMCTRHSANYLSRATFRYACSALNTRECVWFK